MGAGRGAGGAPEVGRGRLVVLDAGAGPPSEQVHDQMLAHVAAGRLAPGDRLPTVRGLAAELGLSTATVAKAYRRLEAAGVTLTATRAGTVVRGPSPDGASVERPSGDPTGGPTSDGAALQAAGQLARATVAAGLDDARAHALLTGALELARRSPRG